MSAQQKFSMIAGTTVESKPGAALHVERIELTEAGRKALTVTRPIVWPSAPPPTFYRRMMNWICS